MKVFKKIKTSRHPLDKKSISVGSLYFNKTDIFTKSEIDEILDFIRNKCPELIGGNTYYVNNYEHLLNNSMINARKFFFVLACLVDSKGKPLFKLVNENGLVAVKIIKIGSITIDTDDPIKN